jgi:hypothetical protein
MLSPELILTQVLVICRIFWAESEFLTHPRVTLKSATELELRELQTYIFED